MKRLAPICLVALSACTSGSGRLVRPRADAPGAATNTLVVSFQTGFKNNAVELHLDHQPVFSEVLTTDNRIGRARSIRLALRDSTAIVADIIVDQVARYSYQIQLRRGHYLGFSKDLDSGSLQMKQSQSPFVYD